MRYVICYDIADDGRRNRVAAALLDFGARIQESVFVADLDNELHEKMIARVGKLVDEEEDRVHVFPLCSACAGRTATLGQADLPKDEEFYVI